MTEQLNDKKFNVIFAVYGGIMNNDPKNSEGIDVTPELQKALDRASIVTINNQSMGHDPCPGYPKHFAAKVEVRTGPGVIMVTYFACGEDEEIDFFGHWG